MDDSTSAQGESRASLLWLATIEYGPFALAATLLLLTSFADQMPAVQRLFPASQVGIYVCVTFVALFAFVLRLTDRVGALEVALRRSAQVQDKFIASARHPITLVSLAQAFREAEATASECSLIRIHAFTSRFISQHMQPRDFSTRHLHLLTSGAGPTQDAMLDMEIQLSVLYTWAGRVRSGNISLLDLRQYDFHPTEWYVVFDDRLMILGTYLYDVHSVGNVGTTQQAFVVRPHGEGSALIQAKAEAFDVLFAAADTNFGPGKYEGTYELIDGVVKVRRTDNEDWVELNPVSQSIPGPP